MSTTPKDKFGPYIQRLMTTILDKEQDDFVDHECVIGNGVHLMGGCYLAGRVKIGNFSSIGAAATILPDINIGENVIVGAGAVVTKNVKSNTVVIGNPAKFLRNNFPKFNSKIFGKILNEKRQKN